MSPSCVVEVKKKRHEMKEMSDRSRNSIISTDELYPFVELFTREMHTAGESKIFLKFCKWVY